MADLGSITAVRPATDAIVELVTYGATISSGQCVYLDASDNEHKLCDASVSAAAAKCRGIAVTPGVDGGPGLIIRGGGCLLVGTTAAVGEHYAVSSTAGGIAPATDLITNDYVTLLGVASTTTQLELSIVASGVQHA